MKAPPGLIAASLMFWGWHTHLLWAAIVLSLALEGAHLLRARWDFSQMDFRRVWSLCTILFVGATIYAFSSRDGTSGLTSLFTAGTASTRSDSLNKTSLSVLVLIQWLPLVFCPMALMQAYSSRETIDLQVFSWLLRTRAARHSAQLSVPEINISYPYMLVCLLGASTSHLHPETFLLSLLMVMAWIMWSFRNRRFSPFVWLGLLLVVVGLSYTGQAGLIQLQKVLQRLEPSWLSRFSRHEVEASGNRTALGVVGRLKLSGRIILRVRPLTQPAPALIREASYNVFDSPWWFASRKKFQPLFPENDDTTWRLLPDKPAPRAVRVARYLSKGQGVLAVPSGTAELSELSVFTLKTNELGVLRVDSGPGLVDFTCHYDEGETFDVPPDEEDRRIPASEEQAISLVARELKLDEISPEEAIARVEMFFRDQFRYSSYDGRRDRRARETPLTRFLTRSRAGHCEYFASATTLLLRAAHIPARYAVGYALIERGSGGFVVRERHAHAWTLAWVNNSWREIDTTPGSWSESEALTASFWEPLRDLWSKVWFRFSQWRWSKTSLRPYLLLILIPPVLLLAARLLFRKRTRRSRAVLNAPAVALQILGLDSEFYQVEKRLIQLGFERSQGQPLGPWLNQTALPPGTSSGELSKLVSLHYRYRFDPKGLSSEERQTLRHASLAWLESTVNR